MVHAEESPLLQGDIQGTMHPNYWGQAVYRDALLRTIAQQMPALQTVPDAPAITSIELRASTVRVHFTACVPADQLYVESSLQLAAWQAEVVTPVIGADGVGYVDVPTAGASDKYFRIGARQP